MTTEQLLLIQKMIDRGKFAEAEVIAGILGHQGLVERIRRANDRISRSAQAGKSEARKAPSGVGFENAKQLNERPIRPMQGRLFDGDSINTPRWNHSRHRKVSRKQLPALCRLVYIFG